MSGRRIVRAAVPLRVDAAVAALLGAVVVAATAGLSHWQHIVHARPYDGFATLWLLAAAAPLVWRTRLPLAAFLVSSGLVFTYYELSGYPGGPALVLPTLALVTLAYRRGPTPAGLVGGAVAAAAIAGVLVHGDPAGALDPRLLGLVLWPVVAVGIGTISRLRRAAREMSAERIAQDQRRRAEEQRLAIAREVHDVVAHSLAMINVQAGVAAHVADRRPEQAREALLAIKDASRAALLDLRATLGVLRSGDDRAPTPGLGRLADLIAATAAAGIEVSAEGEPGPLPAPVDVAAYRIVQESLTNVVRHGAGARAVVITFARTDDELAITVRDDGTGPGLPATGGNGLRGMAERARALGGAATAGPADGGGFAVSARLPLTGGAQ